MSESGGGQRWFRWLAAAAACVALVAAGLAVLSRSSAPATTPSTAPPIESSGWQSFPHPPIEPRFQQAVASNADTMFVWGGCCANGNDSEPFTDGALYTTDAGWQLLPQSPLQPDLSNARAVWTGSEFVVITTAGALTQAAAFDPDSFTWRQLPSPSPSPRSGGFNELSALSDGRIVKFRTWTVELFDPQSGTWTDPIDLTADPEAYPDLQSDSDDGAPRVVTDNAASGTVLALISRSNGLPCAPEVETWDAAQSDDQTNVRRRLSLDADNWAPTQIVGIGGGRFLVVGERCDPSAPSTGGAYLVDEHGGHRITAPPIDIGGSRYNAAWDGNAVSFLGLDGRLVSYSPDADVWTTSASMLDQIVPRPFQIESAAVAFDGAIVIPSSAWVVPQAGGGTICCDRVAQAWITLAPAITDTTSTTTPAQSSTTPPATTDDSGSSPPPETTAPTALCEHIVVVGDSPARLAEQYQVELDELNDANSNNPNYQRFLIGDVIFLPSTVTCDQHGPNSSVPTTTIADQVVYTVEAGDSIYRIASRFGVDPEAIANFNNWTDGIAHYITIGDIIQIPPTPDEVLLSLNAPVNNLAIGDSVMLDAAQEMTDRGYFVNVGRDRDVADLVPILEHLWQVGVLDKTVILHLGNDRPIDDRSLEVLLLTLRDVPNVILVNNATRTTWAAANNELLRAHDAPGDNIILIDWHALAADCPGACFADDETHLTEVGQAYYVEKLGDVLGL